MKTEFFFIFFFFFKVDFSLADHNFWVDGCDCNNVYNFKTGELSPAKSIPNHLYLYLEEKELNTTFLKRKCYALMINDYWLLSVAECFKHFDLKKNKIIVGLPYKGNKKITYENIKDEPEIYTVEEILNFPNYSETEGILENDIFYNFALIKLKKNFFEDDFFLKKIKPACFMYNEFIEKKRKYFVVEESFNGSTCYQTFTYLNPENLYYSDYEEYNFMARYCHENDVYCLSSDNLKTSLKELGTPVYVEIEDSIFVVGMHIGRNFLKKKEFFYSKYSQSITNYFINFNLIIRWLSFQVYLKTCLYKDYGTKEKIDRRQKLKKLSKIEKKCDCEYKELFDYIGNNSFFDPKKYTKRFNSPKKYFRHLVQIVKHNRYDVLDPYRFICTGVVINENFVITTAECANETELNNLYIYFGLRSLEGIEKFDSFFFSYSSKVLEQIFHPFHIPDVGLFRNDLQILRTKLPIEERPNLLSPACFANEKELEKQANDKLLIASFMLLGNFQNRVIDLNRKSNIEFIISKYITDYYHQGVDQCNSLICVPTPINADLGSEGTPLHRFTEYSMEVSGLMKKNVLPVFYKLHRFVPLTKNMKWIKLVVGQFDYCERNEVNRFFDKKICKCDYSISNLLEPNPFIASIIAYKDKINDNEKYVCKSVIINEFWVLTTSACFNKTKFKAKYYYLSLDKKKEEKYTDTEFSNLELTDIAYSIKKFVFNDKLGLALIKSKEKLVIGKHADKYAGCFYRKDREVDFLKPLLLETFEKNIQAKYDSERTRIVFDSKICLENEGTPISLIDEWVESAIVGILNVHSHINYKSDPNCLSTLSKPIEIFPIQKSFNWLDEVVGEKNYCHLENHFFDKRKCTCQDKNVVKIVEKLAGDNAYYQHLCEGIIVNEFWVLTTANCVNKKSRIMININANYEKNFNFTVPKLKENEVLKDILNVYIHPNFNETINKNASFHGLEFNLALIRLDKSFGLGDSPDLEPSCFTEEKKYLDYKYLFSKIPSHNDTVITWYRFKNQNLTDKKFIENTNLLSLQTEQVICDTDQGAPVGRISMLGVMTVGLLSKQDYRYSMSTNKTCFTSTINVGIIANIEDMWFKNKVEAFGVCIYEKYNEFKLANKCDCDLEGRGEAFLLGHKFLNETENSKLLPNVQFKFIASVGQYQAGVFKNMLPIVAKFPDYKFLSTAVIISPHYLITAESSLWKQYNIFGNVVEPIIYFDNLFSLDNYFSANYEFDISFFFKPSKTFYFKNSKLILIKIMPNFFENDDPNNEFKQLVKAPCLTFFNYKNFNQGKLIGVGFGKTVIYNVFDEKKMVLSKKIIANQDFSPTPQEFSTDFTEVLKRNPKANLTCEDKFICVTTNGTISEYDIGGPLLFLKGKALELVGIISIEDGYIPGPYEIFKFTRMSYMEKEIKKIAYDELKC